MSLRRHISFTTALRDMRADRGTTSAGFLAARAHVSMTVRASRATLVTPTGAYDRAVIMQLTVRAAKAQRARTGEAWTVCMSVALKAAWHAAKVVRLKRAH